MKNALLVLLAHCLGSSLLAQDFTIEKGDEYETPRVVWASRVIGSDNSGFYFFRNKNGIANTFILHKIDRATAKTVYEVETKTYPFASACINGRLLLFESESKTNLLKKSISKITLCQLDAATGQQIGEPVQIDELTGNENQLLEFDIRFSPDNKKILLTASVKENKKLQKVICRLYDAATYSRIWEKEAIAVYKNSTVSGTQYLVSNSGTLMYLFEYLRSEHTNEYGRQDDVAYGVGISFGTNSTEKIIEIPNQGLSLKNVKLMQLNNELVCAGNYAVGEKAVSLNAQRGFFMVRIDAEEQVLRSSAYDLVTNKVGEKLYNEKADNTNFTWSLPEVFSINGAYYCVWEHSYSGTSYHNMPAAHYRDEIIVTKYGKDSKLEWMQMVKRSTEPETNALNYFINDKLNLIYYEDPSNIEKNPDPEHVAAKGYASAREKTAVIVCTSLDENGRLSRKIVPFTDRPNLEPNEPLKLFTCESQSLVVPVNITKKTRRYDILKIK